MGFSRQEYWSGVPLPSPKDKLEKQIYYSVKLKRQIMQCISKTWTNYNPGIQNSNSTPHLVKGYSVQFSSVHFSCSVLSDSLRPHGRQHPGLPCSSPTPGACSNSCPASQWCHPTISSSVIPSSSCLQSFSASGSLPMSQSFASGGQSIGVSTSTSVLPMNIKDLFPLGWTG